MLNWFRKHLLLNYMNLKLFSERYTKCFNKLYWIKLNLVINFREFFEKIHPIWWLIYSFIFRDALIITTLDTFTSLLSGVTIFGILGNLAFNMNVDPKEVISSAGGTGLAFISYPEAITKFEAVPWVR